MSKDRKHKVAIVRFTDSYTDYDEYSSNLIASIPVWEEVSDEEYELLVNAASFSCKNKIANQFKVIELLSKDDAVVINNVKSYIKYVEEQREQIEKRKAQRARRAEEKRLKELEKSKESRRKMFEELKKEFSTIAENVEL